MKLRKYGLFLFLGLVLIFVSISFSEELPLPTYDNVVVISIEHKTSDSTEIDYIKNNFNFGLYAWLSFSRTHVDPDLGWHDNWGNAGQGIQSFKDTVNRHIQNTKDKNVRLHIVLCSGLARGIHIYKDAKEEDVRNCQWYNDNKIASDTQITDADRMEDYVFGTFSRYARKMQWNLEAKAEAALDFLKQRMDEEPDVLTVLSGWGEAELNFNRINQSQSLQDYFCDYSPFAVLEFRDWICHTGMYDDSSGKYKGQGYSEGGTKYQGTSGRNTFNNDFGSNFTSWNLKYYNWSLSDNYDTYPQDYVNNDPHRIPYSSYSHGGMMPNSGLNYIAGGFDPPRVMNPGEDFWDLWNLFRETMVYNLVNDMVQWADAAGIPSDKWFSHQIPGDYLFGTNPECTIFNPRYYSSASPLWTADVQPYGSLGATIYDVKFPTFIARTSLYCVPAASAMSSNWAVLEYDAEIYPVGFTMNQSSPSFILDQYMRVYDHNAHIINFWRWEDSSGEHQIKGMNKEVALQNFVENIRDKGRHTNMNFMYDPTKIIGVSGYFNPSAGAIVLELTGKIWNGHIWEWQDWGDFDHFEIHHSTVSGFTPNAGTKIGTTSNYSYNDESYVSGCYNYYRVRAFNKNGVAGEYSDEVMHIPAVNPATLSVNRANLLFGAEQGGAITSPENVIIRNIGSEGSTLVWSAIPSAGWIDVSPASGTGDSYLTIGVNASGFNPGTYIGQVVVSDPNAYNSPQIIEVELNVHTTENDDAPFGMFETPEDGSTVSGTIPVTGWALDDVEVTLIQIKRNSHPIDLPAVIGPDGLVYIGDAVFMEGARPDVEFAYPNQPRNNKAGWGCLILTNFLPNSGNGIFILHAIAYDTFGHRVELGQNMINADNANRIKPFGTIDTPAVGENISGDAYINFGWALTPLPKMIPEDGSTIWVWIDGQPLGHPGYGYYREDIATLFPGYLNSNGAVGYFNIDTTDFANGMHYIAWSVEDNAGAADGMGLRHFTIENLGGNAMQIKPLLYSEDTSGSLSIDVSGWERGYQGKQERQENQEKQKKQKKQELQEKQGLQGNNKLQIEVEEVERIEIHFKAEGGNSFIGWGKDESRTLPEGSNLDQENGIFYWQLGPGFLGRHELNFAVTDGWKRSRPVKVVVNIVTKKFN